jgi:Flp pilus assembly protein CpaB
MAPAEYTAMAFTPTSAGLPACVKKLTVAHTPMSVALSSDARAAAVH